LEKRNIHVGERSDEKAIFIYPLYNFGNSLEKKAFDFYKLCNLIMMTALK